MLLLVPCKSFGAAGAAAAADATAAALGSKHQHSLLRGAAPPAQRLLCAGIAHAVPCRGHAVPAVQAMVCAMLEDAKLEVREMAATTLSGKLVP